MAAASDRLTILANVHIPTTVRAYRSGLYFLDQRRSFDLFHEYGWLNFQLTGG
jgi:hypothetical protein